MEAAWPDSLGFHYFDFRNYPVWTKWSDLLEGSSVLSSRTARTRSGGRISVWIAADWRALLRHVFRSLFMVKTRCFPRFGKVASFESLRKDARQQAFSWTKICVRQSVRLSWLGSSSWTLGIVLSFHSSAQLIFWPVLNPVIKDPWSKTRSACFWLNFNLVSRRRFPFEFIARKARLLHRGR